MGFSDRGTKDMVEQWARRLTHWWSHKHEGNSYSLTHLHPFRFSIELPASEKYAARTVEIRVGFSCHTFTREPQDGDGDLQPYLNRGDEVRMFCHERYPLSKSLPDIIKGLAARKCYFARRENYFVVENHELLAAGQEYRVFFDVRHVGATDAVLLFVQSAYPANRNKGAPHGARRKKIGFRVLVSHALLNTKPTLPLKCKPRHGGGVCTPILLNIPHLVRTLNGRADALSAIASRPRL